MKLYHATKSVADALDIERDGFKGNNIWDYQGVVFLASKPLHGFGGWREAWVEVEVPEEMLVFGEYAEQDQDQENYDADCYCFTANQINQFPRRVFVDSVPGYENQQEEFLPDMPF